MKFLQDEITDAYFNKVGTEFGEKIRKKINWICSQAKGKKILNIGSSLGLTSLLLGREGKNVLGIEQLKESIDKYNDLLSSEPDEVKENVIFDKGNLLTNDFNSEKYDTILLNDVLECMNQPELLLSKSYEVLLEQGNVIITVPFGINDCRDYKRTFYLHDLLNLVNPYFNIIKVEFLGKWIGLVGTKKESISVSDIQINTSLIHELECNFYSLERELLNELKKVNSEYEKYCKKIDMLLKEKSELVSHLDNIKTKLKEIEGNTQIESVRAQASEELKTLVSGISSEMKSQKEMFDVVKLSLVEEKEEKIQIKKELLEFIDIHEKLLREHKETTYKFRLLKNSKLGRLTVRYWKLRGRIHNGW
ncbi:methyltransferase domain-containing protein [Paenibacillus thiaminolyticus]|uniref:methyltransferase domain-containing protein n=1 Tax=Paenibacillus thiaminolyticus TaxID=49283 RepID=UPI0035A744CC